MSRARTETSAGHAPRAWLLRYWRWLVAVAVAVAWVLLVLLLRQPLGEWLWPQNRLQQALRDADAALAEGRLSAVGGGGARELYEAALAMDPDRIEPRQGLARVALEALAQAQREIEAGHFVQAHASLRLARELSAPRGQLQAVADALRAREAADAGLDQLWALAQQAHEAGHLYGDADAALPLYRRILRFDPDHLGALRGRDDAIAGLLAQARAGLRSGELAGAVRAVEVARGFDPGHADLPDTQARLAEERDAALARAGGDLEDGRLEQAGQGYRALLDAGAAVEQAQAGLVQVGLAHAQRAVRMAEEGRFADADAALARAQTLASGHAGVRAAEAQVDAARRQIAGRGPVLDPDERERRVQALLADARAAGGRGDLLTPPGESMYDRLSAARALHAGHPDVQAEVAHLLAAMEACFERELRGNSLGRARACLDARQTMGEVPRSLAAAYRRLAQRWLAIGDERLAAGELPGARAALESAREIDPETPALEAFAGRLRTASGGGE